MSNMLPDFPDLAKLIISHKLLSPAEERELLIKAKTGDVPSRHKLILHNLKLVISERNKMLNIITSDQTTLDECFSLGVLSLHKAIDDFKLTETARFGTYAKWHIKSVIIKYLAEDGTIKVPQSSASKMRAIEKALDKMGIEFSIHSIEMGLCDEIIKKNKVKKKNVISYLATRFANNTSMQQHSFDDGGELGDSVSYDIESTDQQDCDDREVIKEQIELLLHELTDRENVIIMMRFGLDGGGGKTLDLISKILGLTRERVRQIQVKCLNKLRKVNRLKKIY